MTSAICNTKFRNYPVVFIGKIGTFVKDVPSSALNHLVVEKISEHGFHLVFLLLDLDELQEILPRFSYVNRPSIIHDSLECDLFIYRLNGISNPKNNYRIPPKEISSALT